MKRTITLRHFRCFVAVANTGSFTEAASQLFLTQSSLTATIQQFEQAIGVRLFDRSTRRVAMTTEAARFKAEAERILSQFDGALSDLEALSHGRQGHVRIAAVASVTNYFLGDAIAAFRQAYPKITFSLHDASSEQVEKMIANGDIDFAISTSHHGLDELVYTPLFEDRYGVVCAASHAYAQASRPLKWADLDPAEYVGFTEDTGIGVFLRAHAGKPGFFEQQHDEVSRTSSLHAVLRGGSRYSILPALAAGSIAPPPAGPGAEPGPFVFRELSSPRLSREVCLITRRLRSLSASSELFLQYMRDVINDKPAPAGVKVRGRKDRKPRQTEKTPQE